MGTETKQNIVRFVSRGSLLVSLITWIICQMLEISEAEDVQAITFLIAMLVQVIQYYYDDVVIQFERLKLLFFMKMFNIPESEATEMEKQFNERMTTFVFRAVKKIEKKIEDQKKSSSDSQ